MEQQFILKTYANYSIFELAFMTQEERNWVIKRINEEQKKSKQGTTPAPKDRAMPPKRNV